MAPNLGAAADDYDSVRPGERNPEIVPRPAFLVIAGLLLAALLATVTLASFGGSTRVAGEGGGLVLEETPGILARVMGQEPRLRVTAPQGTRLRLALEAPLTSQTARAGDGFAAESTSPVRIEGVEAIPSGVRFSGSVTEAAAAEDSEGRGRMPLKLESVQLPDGSRVSCARARSRCAPRPRRRRTRASSAA